MSDDRAKLLRHAMMLKSEADRHLSEQMAKLYPASSSVSWRKGGREQSGFVRSHAYGAQLFAVNGKTGKEVRISAFDITQAIPDTD